MELEIIVPALAVAYVLIGVVFAGLSLKVWLAGDNLSPLAFLMFPNTFMNGDIGRENTLLISLFEVLKEEDNEYGRRDRNGYLTAVTIFWPLKFVFNTISISVYFVIRFGRLARFAARELAERSEVAAYAPRKSDDLPQLFIKRRALDGSLAHLEAKRSALVGKINALENQKQKIKSALQSRSAEIQDTVGKFLA